MMHAVDLSPLYAILNDTLSELLRGLMIFVAGWVVVVFHRFVTPYLGVLTEEKFATSLNRALQNGVAIAMVQIEGVEKLHSSADVRGRVAAWAVQYAINHAGDAIAHFGLDPDRLAIKALAYLPPAPSVLGLTGETVKTETVTVSDLPPPKGTP
jgi:hypothetical protein